MTVKESVGEVFYTAFKSLSRGQKELLLEKMLRDSEFREDLLDIALIEEAKTEGGRRITARQYFSKRRSKNRKS
jgi:hypothetical protein